MTPAQVRAAMCFESQLALLAQVLPPIDRRRSRFDGPKASPATGQVTWMSNGLIIIADLSVRMDGEIWLHVSFSRRERCPSYDDTLRVRRAFFADDALVIQVFPPAVEHVNLHPFCLHLWSRVTGPRLVCDLRVDERDGRGAQI